MAIPSSNTTGLTELERTLRWHFPRLHRELVDGPRAFPEPHLAIAGHLRVLLCDHKYPPVLFAFAKACGKDLVVYGCRKRAQPKTTVLVAWSAVVASWTALPEYRLERYGAEEFMDAPIGVVQYDVSKPSAAYTPREIINWVANTEGVSHFNYDDRKKPVHRRIKGLVDLGAGVGDDQHLRSILHQLGVWTLHAIAHVVPKEPPLIYDQHANT